MKDEIVLKKFSKRVKDLRKKNGFTQQQLAELADIEYKYIQRIEGQNPPSIGLVKLTQLAKAFKMSVSQFLNF